MPISVMEGKRLAAMAAYRSSREGGLVKGPERVTIQRVRDSLTTVRAGNINKGKRPNAGRKNTPCGRRTGSPVPIRNSEPASCSLEAFSVRLRPQRGDILSKVSQNLLYYRGNRSATPRSGDTGFANSTMAQGRLSGWLPYLVQSHIRPVPCREQD